MKKYDYFEVPTQVKFWDEITCGCCGGIFSIVDIYEATPDTLKEDPIVVYDWVDIISKIRVGDN